MTDTLPVVAENTAAEKNSELALQKLAKDKAPRQSLTPPTDNENEEEEQVAPRKRQANQAV